jgi:hypothetical protein
MNGTMASTLIYRPANIIDQIKRSMPVAAPWCVPWQSSESNSFAERTTTLKVESCRRTQMGCGGPWQAQWQALAGSVAGFGRLWQSPQFAFALFSGLKRENRGKLTKSTPQPAAACHLDNSVLGATRPATDSRKSGDRRPSAGRSRTNPIASQASQVHTIS